MWLATRDADCRVLLATHVMETNLKSADQMAYASMPTSGRVYKPHFDLEHFRKSIAEKSARLHCQNKGPPKKKSNGFPVGFQGWYGTNFKKNANPNEGTHCACAAKMRHGLCSSSLANHLTWEDVHTLTVEIRWFSVERAPKPKTKMRVP